MDNLLSMKKSFWKSWLYTLPMMIILFVFITQGQLNFSNMAHGLAVTTTFLFMVFLFFMMHYTGKTDRFRAILFIFFAVALSFAFTKNMLEARNSISISEADFLECKIPFCHLVVPMMIIPAALTKSIIFPGSILDGFANISSMVVLWFLATLALGRGFCSWGCFYGGWDDGFSRIGKKPIIKKINGIWKWMPFAVLLLVAITAALSLSPTYCDWICPFKAVTEYEKVTSVESAAKTVVFLSLFLGLVVTLPILTKKRTQCSFLCPLGAINSLSNKINPFTIKIDKTVCTECMKCVKACPMFALSEEGVKNGEVSIQCSKCGKCLDVCTKQALHFGIKGVPAGTKRKLSRNLFLFISFLFLAVFSSGSIQTLLQSLFSLIFGN